KTVLTDPKGSDPSTYCTTNFLAKYDCSGNPTANSLIFDNGSMIDISGNTLTADGVLTLEAGGRLTSQAGNDLNIVAPTARSIFFKINSMDQPTIAMDNRGWLGLGLMGGGVPTGLLDVSGTTISNDGILTLEPGGKLTT